jgi:hypothetical protein
VLTVEEYRAVGTALMNDSSGSRICESGWIEVRLAPGEREPLDAVIGSVNSPQQLVWRVRIVLLRADGVGTMAIQRQTGKAKPTSWRWQARFMIEGVDGLLHDATRPAGKSPLTPAMIERVVRMTLTEPPGETTHWTCRAIATGVSHRRVHRIRAAHGLKPHRVRTFKLSSDPKFAGKVKDVVGLYVYAPGHALVLSVDEEWQIQALDRTPPRLPMKRGRCGTTTDDYKRHGTTTLFAALDVVEGLVIGQSVARHRHQEFIWFLDTNNRETPAAPELHLIVDNYVTHKHPKVRAWLERHPRFHYTSRDLGFLAQRGRGLLHQIDLAAAQARRLQRHRRPAGRHQSIPHRNQRQPKTLPLDRRSRPLADLKEMRTTDDCVNPNVAPIETCETNLNECSRGSRGLRTTSVRRVSR